MRILIKCTPEEISVIVLAEEKQQMSSDRKPAVAACVEAEDERHAMIRALKERIGELETKR